MTQLSGSGGQMSSSFNTTVDTNDDFLCVAENVKMLTKKTNVH